MTIKKKIYTIGAITFVLFVILALMAVWTHQQVLANLRTRDRVNEKLDALEKFARWKNELIRSISDIVASGHRPPSADELFEFPPDGFGKERAALVNSGKKLVSLIGEKEQAVKNIERTFADLRIQINGLYYRLDNRIATVLAIAQMDQVLGTDTSEKTSLAPYVLKSLNQLTLVAQNGIISRSFSEDAKGVVAQNRRFLSAQLSTIDTDGSIAALFEGLFALTQSIETFSRDSNRTLAYFDTRIAAAKKEFDQAVRGTEIEAVVKGAHIEVQRASEALETSSRRNLVTVLACLLVVPILVIVFGIFGLNSTIVGPITSLVEAMKKVENGRFDVTAPVKTRDEIGALARAFNAMAAEIRSKVMELSMLNHDLTVSEAKYRTLVDNLPQRIFLKRRDLSYVSCNRHFADDLGTNAEEIVGKTDYDLFPKKLAEKYRKDDLRVLETETTEEIEESYFQNGEQLIVQTVKTPVRDETGNVSGVLGIFWDISERKRVEEELHLARFSLENASVAMFWIDAGGRLRYVNECACEMLSYSRRELTAMSIWDVDTEFSPERFALVWQEMSHEQPVRFESTQRRKDGSEFPVEISARQSEFRGNRLNFVFCIDITERKEAERRMLESRELHRSIIQTAMDGFWIVDTLGRLIEVNEAYCRMSGFTERELLSMNVEELETRETDADVRDHIALVAQNSEDRFETRHRRKDGSHFDVEVSVQYRTEQGGRLVCFLRDVTERNKMEAQLIQAQKMEAVGTLVGGISHDFNNLLQVINGHAQLLLMEKTDGHPEYRFLKAIHDSGFRASELVRQLLLFSRKADSQHTPVDLNEEVDQARRMLERTIPKMIDIKIRTQARLWTIQADSIQIEQILLNLGTNAADAMPEGGRLIIETENVVLDREYAQTHFEPKPGRYVLLTVSDTGHGIDKETIERIFDPFFTTKEFGKGTGLGLASVYGIVKSHGGYIICYSEVGQGTTFKMYFPASEQTEVAESREVDVPPIPRGTETILIVDDEEAIRGLAQQALMKYGYTVMTASTGEEGLGIYSDSPAGIDLILMDLGMPGMGGHKCLQGLLEFNPQAKVIIASGYSINGQVKKSMEAGAKAYVGKPYKLADLLSTVRAVLDENG